MFASIFSKSSNTFEGEKSYENVLVLLRRHISVLMIAISGFIIWAALPFVLYIFVKDYLLQLRLSDMFWLIAGIFYMFWWLSLSYRITMYLLDVWVVTDHRIIDNQQFGFFNRVFSEMGLGKIQDVSVRVEGLLPTTLDFGDLEVQTAAAEAKFKFEQIPEPQKTKDLIMQAHNKFVHEHIGGREIHES